MMLPLSRWCTPMADLRHTNSPSYRHTIIVSLLLDDWPVCMYMCVCGYDNQNPLFSLLSSDSYLISLWLTGNAIWWILPTIWDVLCGECWLLSYWTAKGGWTSRNIFDFPVHHICILIVMAGKILSHRLTSRGNCQFEQVLLRSCFFLLPFLCVVNLPTTKSWASIVSGLIELCQFSRMLYCCSRVSLESDVKQTSLKAMVSCYLYIVPLVSRGFITSNYCFGKSDLFGE